MLVVDRGQRLNCKFGFPYARHRIRNVSKVLVVDDIVLRFAWMLSE